MVDEQLEPVMASIVRPLYFYDELRRLAPVTLAGALAQTSPAITRA